MMRQVLAELFQIADLCVLSLNVFPQLCLALLKAVEFGLCGVLG